MLSRCLSTLVHVSQAADEHKASALLCRAGITHGAWGGSNQAMHNVLSPCMQPPGTLCHHHPALLSGNHCSWIYRHSQTAPSTSWHLLYQPFKGKSSRAQETTASVPQMTPQSSPACFLSRAGCNQNSNVSTAHSVLVCHIQGNSIMFPESQHGLECLKLQQGLFRLALLQACSAPPVFRFLATSGSSNDLLLTT